MYRRGQKYFVSKRHVTVYLLCFRLPPPSCGTALSGLPLPAQPHPIREVRRTPTPQNLRYKYYLRCTVCISLGREEAQGCSSTSVFFLSIIKKTIIHLLFCFFSPISVHFRPVACIVRLPKWFARLKSLQKNTRP